jgi:prepilin peptidase CpaA
MTIAEAVAVAVVIVACVWDVRTSRIPNVLTFTAIGLAPAFHLIVGGGASYATLGLLVGLAVLFPMFALGAMGAGDVKTPTHRISGTCRIREQAHDHC